MRILIKIISFVGFILQISLVRGQLRDTSLFTLYSEPFFYNVLKDQAGGIYSGTSEGIFRMEGSQIVKIDDRTGYITLDQSGRLSIDSNGIKYHEQKSYSYMLPFPSEMRDEFHAGKDDFFYISAGGKMHVYVIRPYGYLYRNHSVRTISKSFVGTYSGIYYKGRKLAAPFPRFSDGYIRELDGKALICYSTLFVADIEQGDSLSRLREISVPGLKFDYISDICFSKQFGRYFAATKSELGSMDQEMTVANTLYTSPNKNDEVVLLGEERAEIIFASGPQLMRVQPASGKVSALATLPEAILDGELDNRNYFLLGSQGLYVFHSDGKLEKLVDLKKAHTLLSINKSELAIGTDAGLFLYNTQSQKLSVLIGNVEFNRRGLFLDNDRLYAGSINGLYVLDSKRLESLTEMATQRAASLGSPKYVLPLVVGLVLLTVILTIMLYRSRIRFKQIQAEMEQERAPEVTREQVELFIRENLALASLKSISEKFGTNNANIYTLLAPEKPGAFINRLRMEQVQKMRADRRSAREIAEQTGFSESYVRKVWNNS